MCPDVSWLHTPPQTGEIAFSHRIRRGRRCLGISVAFIERTPWRPSLRGRRSVPETASTHPNGLLGDQFRPVPALRRETGQSETQHASAPVVSDVSPEPGFPPLPCGAQEKPLAVELPDPNANRRYFGLRVGGRTHPSRADHAGSQRSRRLPTTALQLRPK